MMNKIGDPEVTKVIHEFSIRYVETKMYPGEPSVMLDNPNGVPLQAVMEMCLFAAEIAKQMMETEN